MTTVSFATFNLENLQAVGKKWHNKEYSDEEYKAKITWTADIVKKTNADIIAFQELWSPECLQDVFRAAGLLADYTPYYIKKTAGTDPWLSESWYDIAVAMVVRKPWTLAPKNGKDGKAVHKEFPAEHVLRKNVTNGGADDDVSVGIQQFSRSVLELNLVSGDNNASLTVLAVHLKSKLPTGLDDDLQTQPKIKKHAKALGAALSTIRRTAEASALRVILDNAMKDTDAPVVVLGDFNDSPHSNTLDIITGQPAYRVAHDGGATSDAGLYNAASLEDMRALRDIQFTHEHNGVLDSLDHILVSEQFYDYSKKRIWTLQKTRVWNDHVGDKSGATSDHGVVAAYFKYQPYK